MGTKLSLNLSAFLIISLGLSHATAATSRTVNKPGGGVNNYTTITSAIAASANGDTITVYHKSDGSPYKLDLGGEAYRLGISKNLTLQGYDYGEQFYVTIDGNNEDTAIKVWSSTNGVVVKNFKITNCAVQAAETDAPNTTFENITFYDNTRYALTYLTQATGEIRNCSFIGTVRDVATGTYGTGCRILGDDCDLIDCDASLNDLDGFRIEGDNVVVDGCTSSSNSRQGLKTDGVSDLLIDDSTFHSNAASGIQVESGSSNVEIRNSTCYNNGTGGGGNESGIWLDDSNEVLIEDCIIRDNQHAIHIDGDGVGCKDIIVRFNSIYNNTKNFGAAPTGGGVHVNGVTRLAVYHNTIWNNGLSTGSQNNYGNDRGGFGTTVYVSPDYSNSGVSFLNNIVGSIKGKANSHIVQVGSTSEIEDWHHNVYYSGAGDIDQYRIGNTTPISFSSWDGTAGIDESGSVDASSAPVDSGLNPIVGGAAHNSASSLTSVKGTGGSTVELYNANYFVVGDVVKTSGGTVATITAINYLSGDVSFSASIPTGSSLYLNRTGNSNVDIGAKQN